MIEHSRCVKVVGLTVVCLSAFAVHAALGADSAGVAPGASAEAEVILDKSGVKGGLVVHFGCSDGMLTAALRKGDRYLVHGVALDAVSLETARRRIQSLGLYGNVSVEPSSGNRLPYIDNLVNLFVAEDMHGLPLDEVLRVLVPGGVACVRHEGKWVKTVKPKGAAIDELTHALYDASNNAVSKDAVVGPPQHLQWVAEPRNDRNRETPGGEWLASVSVVVSAGGRLFSILDEAPAASVLLPVQWQLVARDAFNGMLLWKKPIAHWEPRLRQSSDLPRSRARRLVAVGERVYVALGFGAPVTVLDAATGRTVTTCQETQGTEEILYRHGMLFVVVSEAADMKGGGRTGPPSKAVMAVDATAGRSLWKRTGAEPLPMSLAVSADRVFWLAPDAVVCVDATTGADVWRAERTVARHRPDWSAPTLVVQDGVVLCADRRPTPVPNVDESTGRSMQSWLAESAGAGDLVAYSAATGEPLWTAKCGESYQSPIDVFIHDGLVWLGQSRGRQGPDYNAARDLLTGEIKRRIPSERAFANPHPHHRCYRDRATARYLVTGRSGVEFIDFQTGDAFRHHWVRGSCQYGVVPANGLLYAPPHPCACYIESRLIGFNALAPRRTNERAAEDRPKGNVAIAQNTPHATREEIRHAERDEYGRDHSVNPEDAETRLRKGPAYNDELPHPSSFSPHPSEDWSTHRHDAARSGCATTVVPSDLKCAWQARLGGRLSSPVIAEGRILVASIDAHTIHAFDATDGHPLWQYASGGRVDSPPTAARGRAVFGSADGWVYCLRASDGQPFRRYRAAPEERRLVAFGQVESTWPVHGSVLVRDGSVCCAAGRSSYLDGGIRLCRLDLRTGKSLAAECLNSRDPRTGEQPSEPVMFEMPGALPDVLSCDGKLMYMRHLAFDPEDLKPQRKAPAHLYSPAGFLNDDWWNRTYWILGNHFYSGYVGWYFAGHETPAGRLLAIDDSAIYGFGYRPEFYRTAQKTRYHLFAIVRRQVPPQPPVNYGRAFADAQAGKSIVPLKWSKDVPVLARAMVLSGQTLFVAGPPANATESKPAYEGAQGAMLCAVSAADGKILVAYRLDGLPVFDGLAAAHGRLFLTTQDGRLLCLSDSRSTPGGDKLERVVTK